METKRNEQVPYHGLRPRSILRWWLSPCRREMSMLCRRDHDQRFRFTDIDALGFSPEALGRTRDELMARIHARLPDGTWICGVEGVPPPLRGHRLPAPCAVYSRWPVISPLLDIAYTVFPRNRRRLTGRCSAKARNIKLYTMDKASATQSSLVQPSPSSDSGG